jgi:hypothetical protein
VVCLFRTRLEALRGCLSLCHACHTDTTFLVNCQLCREEYVSAFTRTIYFQGIAVSVAFGDNAPLVGHNAFLRWSALRAVSSAATLCHAWAGSVLHAYVRCAVLGASLQPLPHVN